MAFEPVVLSLLDTDLYKFTMWQPLLHRHPRTQATYRFVLRNAPGFNPDRVATPLLLTVNGINNRTSFLELYVGLRANGRAVELLHFPQGEHELKKPREREASLQATVDWVSFWLLGVESAATPARSEQFSRWRALQSLRRGSSTLPGPARKPSFQEQDAQ